MVSRVGCTIPVMGSYMVANYGTSGMGFHILGCLQDDPEGSVPKLKLGVLFSYTKYFMGLTL